ncbi:hypothetical protein Dsin_008709 [Dipteronia sinensis]|uniref:Reverse transcriptase zinc-binding domain-containing protein n=1 Tax=Dipteronia sinensis TaxID=43782 RepID=A0AAE0AQB8_9ROSI|nr:hypothetical protein Dsin_008709 [Dipteronia sinensis]
MVPSCIFLQIGLLVFSSFLVSPAPMLPMVLVILDIISLLGMFPPFVTICPISTSFLRHAQGRNHYFRTYPGARATTGLDSRYEGAVSHAASEVSWRVRVSDFNHKGWWVLDDIFRAHFTDLCFQIDRIAISPVADSLVLAHSRDRQVSCKLAYSRMIRGSPRVPWWMDVWCCFIPPSSSTLTWHLLLNRLPIEDRLCKAGFHLVSQCSVCGVSGESSDHLFLRCSLVATLWEMSMSVGECSKNARGAQKGRKGWQIARMSHLPWRSRASTEKRPFCHHGGHVHPWAAKVACPQSLIVVFPMPHHFPLL